jgi:hypothetical protein
LLANGLASFSADKGQLLWRYGKAKDRFGENTANIPTPIVKGNQVFAAAGYGRGAALITITSKGGKFDVKTAGHTRSSSAERCISAKRTRSGVLMYRRN